MKRFVLTFIFMFLAAWAYAAVDFDNVDDSLTCGTNDTLIPEGVATTISAWINPDTINSGAADGIVARSRSDNGKGVIFDIRSSTQIQFNVGGSTDLIHLSSTSSVSTGSWQHVLVTWDGSTTAANSHIYVNGTEVSYATTTNGVTLADNVNKTLTIGSKESFPKPFDGKISEVAIWDIELTATEIQMLASSRVKRLPLQIQPSHLKAYWALDSVADGSAANALTFADLSGNGNTCTGDDGANNTGMLGTSEYILSYSDGPEYANFDTVASAKFPIPDLWWHSRYQ